MTPEAPLVLPAVLGLALFGYGRGLLALWGHAGVSRGLGWPQAASFLTGWGVLAGALLMPLEVGGADRFSLHMLQHELLMVLAAPLLVAGRPLAAWAWALPLAARRAVGAFFHHPAWRGPWLAATTPLAAAALHAGITWAGHLPAWVDAAHQDPALQALQQVSLLGGALLFWSTVLRRRSASGQGAAVSALFGTAAQTGALGGLLAFADVAWYAAHGLQDQQLGGLLMWMPGGLVYLGVGFWLATTWFGREAEIVWPRA